MLVLAIGDLHIPDRALDLPSKFHKLLTPGKISQVLCLGNVTSSPTTLEFLKSLSPDFHSVKGEFDESGPLPLYSTVSHDSLKIGFTNGHTIVPQSDPLALLTLARQLDVDILLWGGTHRIEAYTLDGKFFVNPGSATGAFTINWPDKEEDIEGEIAEKVDKEGNEHSPEKDGDDKADKETKDDATTDDASSKNEKTDDANNKKEETIEKKEEEDEVFVEPIDPVPSFCLLDIQGSVCTLYIYTYLDGEVKVDKVSYRKEQTN